MRPSPPGRIQRIRHDSPLGRWDFAACRPPAPLAEYVEVFWEVEGEVAYTRERILPRGQVEVLFNLGPSHRLLLRDDGSRGTEFRTAWVAGLQQEYLLVESPWRPRIMGIRFQPAGAYAFFGLPLDELSHRVIDLVLVLGAGALELRDRLVEATTHEERFALLSGFVEGRLRRGPEACAGVAHAVAALLASGGSARIGDLCREIGCSPRRFIQRFKREVGLPPKAFAKVLRFRRVIEQLKDREAVSWAALAQDCGYYDQAHFINDFYAFAGATPVEFLRRRSPDGDSLVDG